MDKQLANYFFEEASKAFAFVVNEHSFAAPLLEVDDKINFAFVIFMGKNLAIECLMNVKPTSTAKSLVSPTERKRLTTRLTKAAREYVRDWQVSCAGAASETVCSSESEDLNSTSESKSPWRSLLKCSGSTAKKF